MEFKSVEDALTFIFTYELDTYPPINYEKMTDEKIIDHAYQIYEFLKLIDRRRKFKNLTKN